MKTVVSSTNGTTIAATTTTTLQNNINNNNNNSVATIVTTASGGPHSLPPVVAVVKTEPNVGDATSTFSTPNATTATGVGSNGVVGLGLGVGTILGSTGSSSSSTAAKRPASLDLNKLAPTKKTRGGISPSPCINTPDLEKYLLSNGLIQTPQPGVVFPAKIGPVTSEQEEFGKGFEEALHSLHTSKNSQVVGGQLNTGNTVAGNNNNNNNNTTAPVTTASGTASITTTAGNGMSGGSFTYTNLESAPFPVAIKDEPQNPSTSPPVSPIDMETQEKIKLERKRQRNRVAASKCRKRKLERISKLEDKVKILKGENADLGSVVKSLKDHVAQLKQQVIEHIEAGCSIPTVYNGSPLLQVK